MEGIIDTGEHEAAYPIIYLASPSTITGIYGPIMDIASWIIVMGVTSMNLTSLYESLNGNDRSTEALFE
jgi:hypothetical protein